MIQKLVRKIKMAALVAPIMAQDITFGSKVDNFKPLEDLKAESIIQGAISLVLVVVALVFFFMLVLGGLKWVMSEGDEKSVTAARNQITNALIGLAIVFSAWAIMRLIGIVFGVNILGGIKIPTLQ